MQQTDKLMQTALIEMFKRVGLDFSWGQILSYADKNPDWFLSRAWTQGREDDFATWLENHFYKSKYFKIYAPAARRRMVKKEVGYFLLTWGWTTSFPSTSETGEKKENE